jgi:hypothetical protein
MATGTNDIQSACFSSGCDLNVIEILET